MSAVSGVSGGDDVAPAVRRRDAATALAVTVAAAVVFSLLILPLPQEAGQFSKYPNAALQQLHGTVDAERLLDFSQLYLALHVAAFRFLADPLGWLPRVHVALLSLAAGLLHLLLRRHFTPALALLGAAAFVLGKSVAIYGHIFEPEPLMILLLTATVLFASRATLPGAAAAGACLALSLLTRPSFLPLALLVPVHFSLRAGSRKRLLATTAAFLLPLALAAALLAARSERLLGSPSLLVMNPGTVFFDGNNPLASGRGAAYPPVVSELAASRPGESDFQHAVYRLLARASSGAGLSPAQANRYWAAKAEDFLADHPGHFLRLSARRAAYLFHGYRWDDIRAAWAAGRSLEGRRIPFVPFALLSALALVGLVAGLGRWRAYFLPYAVFLNQAGLMTLTYATDRQRVSIYPFFVFFAVAALASLAGAPRRVRAATVAAAALLFALFTMETDRMRDNRHVWEGFSRLGPVMGQALAHRDALDFAAAREETATALALGPWLAGAMRPAVLPGTAAELAALAERKLASLRPDDASTRLDRALLLIEAGRPDEAAALLEALERSGAAFERLSGRPSVPAYSLGRIAARRGDSAEAARRFERALAETPGDPETLAQLACLRGEDARAAQLFRYFDDADALFLLGRACLEQGRPAAAATALERLSALVPEYQPGRVALAAALGASGEDARAAEIYLSATEQPPGMVRFEEWIVPLFERRARSGPPGEAHRYAAVLRQYGRFPEAEAALVRGAGGGNAEAAAELERFREERARARR